MIQRLFTLAALRGGAFAILCTEALAAGHLPFTIVLLLTAIVLFCRDDPS